MSSNLYAPPKAIVADLVAGEAAPALWNPGAAASWSLLFTPAFGAFLHMRNWQALGEARKAAAAKMWALVYIAALIASTAVSAALPRNRELADAFRLGGFGVLITWYYASGKSQVDFVRARYGRVYPRKGWALPILIAVGTLVGFIVAIGILAAAMQAFRS